MGSSAVISVNPPPKRVTERIQFIVVRNLARVYLVRERDNINFISHTACLDYGESAPYTLAFLPALIHRGESPPIRRHCLPIN